MSTDNKLADALHVLLAACDDSDSAMYGTLGVSFVRDVAQAALAEHDAKASANYVLVPRVPTEAMFDAGVERHRPQNMSAARLRLIWDAMLSAVPGQSPANGEAMTDERALELVRWLTNGSDASPPPPDVTLQQAYDHIAARLKTAQEPVAEVTEGGYMERSIVWLEAAADLPAGVHKLYTATPALPEVTDEDEAEAWDVLLITGQPIDSCACDGDMRAVLKSYRARLMTKGVPND